MLDREIIRLIGEDTWRCLKCRSTFCVHITNWRIFEEQCSDNAPPNDPIFWTSSEDSTSDDRHYCDWVVNNTPISVKLENIIQTRGFADISVWDHVDIKWDQIKPTIVRVCECGDTFSYDNPFYHCTTTIYGLSSVKSFDAPYYPCNSKTCLKKLEFESLDFGLFRATREVLLDLVFVSRIYNDMVVAGSPMSSIFQVMNNHLTGLGLKFMSRETFRKCCILILKRYILKLECLMNSC